MTVSEICSHIHGTTGRNRLLEVRVLMISTINLWNNNPTMNLPILMPNQNTMDWFYTDNHKPTVVAVNFIDKRFLTRT
jgi:hypothetical protein